MARPPFTHPATRREFLRSSASGLGLIAFSQVAPAFLTHSVRAEVPRAEKDRSILVLIQLAGGNDGLNTLVPFEDDRYYRMRPRIGLARGSLHRLNDQLGLHPSCGPLARLFHEGQLGIVQNVGYPNPNRSHFRSMEIWETAAGSDEYRSSGWLGRFFDNTCAGTPGEDPVGLSLGNELPDAFLAEGDHNVFGLGNAKRSQFEMNPEILQTLRAHRSNEASNAHFLEHTLMNALVTEERVLARLRGYKPLHPYPDSGLGRELEKVAALIAAGQETRVYFVSLGGFDTHAGQLNRHQNLLAELAGAMAAFQADLVAHKLDDQVLTMTFSEFGRRPQENESGGTDHGTAAPLLVMGPGLRGNLFGTAPDLDLASNRDLRHTTDFRAVYQTVIERWFEADPRPILGSTFKGVDFL